MALEVLEYDLGWDVRLAPLSPTFLTPKPVRIMVFVWRFLLPSHRHEALPEPLPRNHPHAQILEFRLSFQAPSSESPVRIMVFRSSSSEMAMLHQVLHRFSYTHPRHEALPEPLPRNHPHAQILEFRLSFQAPSSESPVRIMVFRSPSSEMAAILHRFSYTHPRNEALPEPPPTATKSLPRNHPHAQILEFRLSFQAPSPESFPIRDGWSRWLGL
jgi:hypothetical protein